MLKATISKQKQDTMSITFLVKIKQGGLDWNTSYNLARWLDFAKENEGLEMRLTKLEHKRSLSQNNLYWKFLELIEIETGNTANDLHEYFKRVHLPPKFIKVMGKEIKIPKSTTELSRVEFGEYLDKISAESNVEIPNVQEFNEFKNSASLISD